MPPPPHAHVLTTRPNHKLYIYNTPTTRTRVFGLEVLLVRRGLYARVVAPRASVVLPAGVPHLVLVQGVVVGGPEAALVARERLLAGVQPLVEFQRTGQGGRVPADVASVRPHADVHVGDVLVQHVLGGEAPATVLARQFGLWRRLLGFLVDRLCDIV